MRDGRRLSSIQLLLIVFALFAAGAAAAQNGQNVTLKPSSGMAGTSVDVVARGVYIDPASVTITFQPAGLTVRNARLEARELGFTIDIAPNAPSGEYTLVITPNAGTGRAAIAGVAAQPLVVPNAFRVLREVRVTGINPAQITAGTTTTVTITGSGFAPKAKLIFVGTADLKSSVKNVTDSMMTATITAPPNAALGAFNVIVENVDGTASHKQKPLPSITVVAPQAAPVPPVVARIAPATAVQGSTLLLRIDGTGFKPGAVVSLGNGVGVKVVSVAPEQIVANVAVAATAPVGAHRVVVRNPDNLSNEAQPSPVDLTITAAPPAQPPKVDPPAQPPVKVDPPKVEPPKVEPPKTPPPATTPPKTTPPTPPATTPLPPATKPPTPPVATPPVVKPPAIPQVPMPPPPTTLQGPRVDAVQPQSLTPGVNYTLELSGKNLAPDTKISFGTDVTVVGVPIVLSPTKAKLQVMVSPAAKPGVLAAVASGAAGKNSGPGGVMIATANKQNQPGSKSPSPPPPKAVDPGTKLPIGTIKLTAPCDPMVEPQCDDAPLLTDAVHFKWKELTPGISDVFVFEIVDSKEKVLYSAQAKSPQLAWSTSKLTSLLEKKSSGAGPATGTYTGGVQQPAGGTGGFQGAAGGIPMGAGTTPSQGVPHAKKLTDFEHLVKSYPNAVYWRVRGMRKKSGGRPNELYLAADSDVRPLALPHPPSGFSCPAGAKSKIALVPIPSGETYAAPCAKTAGKYSTNICSGMTARFSDDSTVDLAKVPFELGQIGSIGNDGSGSAAVAFYGVYVDWGDGSEPYPLVVDGDDSPSLSKAKLYVPSLKHTYTNKNTSDEFREYVARVYAISSDTPQSLTALAQAAAKAASSGATQDNKNVHTLACTRVKVWNEVDATKDGPLTLLSAVTVFPDDWAKLAQYAMSGVNGTNDVNAVAIQPNGGLNVPMGAGSAAGSKGTNSGGTAGGVPGGNAGSLAPGAVKAPAAPGAAATYSIDTSQITKVSECAEAFRPFVRIQYYGRGRARVRWTLDGKVIDEHETPELPPVTYSDGMAFKRTYDIDLSMPLPSKLKSGANLHTLKVHVETGKLPGSMTSATGASKAAGMQGMTPGSSKTVHSTVPPATGGGASLAPASGAKLSSGGNAPTGGNLGGAMTPSQGGNAAKGIGAGGAGQASVFDPGAGDSSEGPFSAVDAGPRTYQLVAQLPGVPCRILYKTAKSGTVVISDITGFTLDTAGSSGTGKLHIPFAGEYGAMSKEYGYATVSFSKWKLEPRSGDPTQFDALSGSLNAKSFAKGTVRNFPVEITNVALDAQQLLIDGTVSLPAKNISPTIGAMPKFSFAKVPMGAGGHFAFTSKTTTRVGLGQSHFELDITQAEFDFGYMDAPPSACSKTSFGGALISGTLRAPKELTFGSKPIFSDVKVGPWAVTPQGLAVKLDDLPIGTSVNEGKLTFATSAVSLNTCDGGIAPKFALNIGGVPFFTEGVNGDGSLDAHGNLLVALHPATAAKSWSNADAKVSSLSLHREENWYFLANGSFAFRAYGKPFHTVDYEGLRLGFDGTVELPPLPVGNVAQATISLAGFPMTITKFTAGSKSGALQFTFTGDIKFAEHVKNATNRDVTFKLPYANASLLAAPAMQLAETSLEDGPLAMLAPPPDQGGGGEDPSVQSVDIDLQFPPGSGMVTIKATSTWSSSPHGYRFTTDNGTISVLDSFAIEKTRFVFGNDNGESYWLAQASYKLPVPIQLATTPLYLFYIGGGLGHNIDIQSFNAPIADIVAAHQPSTYLFNANVDIATLDGMMFWSNGGLTVKLGDGFAARADLKAWLLTDDHAQAPMGVGCMQYAGGAFSAGFGMHYEAAYGKLVVDAPVGADACQAAAVHIYFGSDDWHVNLGSPGARVSAKVAGAGGSGSLAINSKGAAFDFAVHYADKASLDIGICTAEAGYYFDWGIGAGFQYSPFNLKASGEVGVAVSASCGALSAGAGGKATMSVSLPASTQICGSLQVYVHVLGDDYNLINTGNFCL